MARVAKKDGGLLALVLTLSSAIGLYALAAPFLDPARTVAQRTLDTARSSARADDAPLLFFLLLGCCLLAIILGLETRRFDARRLAALGTLLGLNAVLRLIPGPGGFSAVFLLPILCGYVMGPTFGFLLGSLTMVVSGILVNALGPWLPFQMLAAGWIGLISGMIGQRARPTLAAKFESRKSPRWILLTAWAAAAGLVYGVIVNLWFWPYLILDGDGWDPALGLGSAIARYTLFYLGSSMWWDLGRVAGNVILILSVGPAIVRLLRRFESRFGFTVDPATAP
ncbi:MAG: ECF transporter S component [Acidobacteriota bacterium]